MTDNDRGLEGEASEAAEVGAGDGVLGALSYYESLRSNAEQVKRTNSVDVVTFDVDGRPSSSFYNASSDPDTLAFCHLVTVMPISFFPKGPTGPRAPFTFIGILEGMFALLLAATHLNSGDGRIVKEVEGLNERCDVRFTTELIDNALSEYNAVKDTIDVLERSSERSMGREWEPCAFVGNGRSAVTTATSIITGIYGYPQFSPISTSTMLDDKQQYKLFGRHITSDEGTAVPAIMYLSERLGVQHLGVVHNNDAYGNAYARALQKVARELAPTMQMQIIDMPFVKTPENFVKAVSFLKSTKYRFFFAIIEASTDYKPLMEEAYKQGIAGDGKHFWIFSDSVTPNTVVGEVLRNSPLHLAARGACTLASIGGMSDGSGEGNPYDAFVESWRSMNNRHDLDVIRRKRPDAYDDDPEYEGQVPDDIFFANGPGWVAPFVYDSAVALGLAACNVTRSNPPGEYFTGEAHYRAALGTRFEGATGNIVLNGETGTRDPLSATFMLTNYVEEDLADGEGDFVMLRASEADVFRNGQWENLAPFVFNDGSTTPPEDLPTKEVDMNYIGWGFRSAGLIMSACVVFLSIGFVAWTYQHRLTRVVRASQAMFLYLICGGTLLMGAAIIPLSLDDEVISQWGCTVACMAVPWMLCVGFSVSFSALCSKTWRVNMIFHSTTPFKKVAVRHRDVMIPFVGFLAANCVVLIVWTVVDPLVWNREVIRYDEWGRDAESLGTCGSDDHLPYVITLVVVNLGVLFLVTYQAYVARDVSLEFAETKYIGLALSCCVLVCFVGIPVMFIGYEAKTSFFVLSCIVFVLCSALLLFIFIPKIRFHWDQSSKKRKSTMKNILKKKAPSLPPTTHSEIDDTNTEGLRIIRNPSAEKDFMNKYKALEERNRELEHRVTLLQGRPPDESALNGRIDHNVNALEEIEEEYGLDGNSSDSNSLGEADVCFEKCKNEGLRDSLAKSVSAPLPEKSSNGTSLHRKMKTKIAQSSVF